MIIDLLLEDANIPSKQCKSPQFSERSCQPGTLFWWLGSQGYADGSIMWKQPEEYLLQTPWGMGKVVEAQWLHEVSHHLFFPSHSTLKQCLVSLTVSLFSSSLLHKNAKPSQQEVEDSFDGHVCRCTGYRSILDAMKSFAGDSTMPSAKCIDIEVGLMNFVCYKPGFLVHLQKLLFIKNLINMELIFMDDFIFSQYRNLSSFTLKVYTYINYHKSAALNGLLEN